MKYDYHLEIEEISIYVFTLSYAHTHEEPAVYDFMVTRLNNPNADSVIRKAYQRRFGRSIQAGSCSDLLGLLLATGANLVRICGSERHTLSKNYFPVSYHGLKGSHAIKIGDFYRTSITNADEQFPRFCEWLNSLSSLPLDTRHEMELLVMEGYSIIALEARSSTVLVNVADHGQVLDAQPATISYLNRNSTN